VRDGLVRLTAPLVAYREQHVNPEVLRALAEARTETERARQDAVKAHARMLTALRRIDREGSTAAELGDSRLRATGEPDIGVAHGLDGIDRADRASNGPSTGENRSSEQQ
jgi:hypothetical protein